MEIKMTGRGGREVERVGKRGELTCGELICGSAGKGRIEVGRGKRGGEMRRAMAVAYFG